MPVIMIRCRNLVEYIERILVLDAEGYSEKHFDRRGEWFRT